MAEIVASMYEIIKRIGAGGGGVVYLANHLRLNKQVVLKADKREVTTDPEILRREVDVLKNLNHKYIPQVYDFFIENDTVYTVIDFVEGESMDKALKRGQKFSQAQVIKWAIQLLEAIVYLHEPIHGEPPHGIVHSDIKPANIMLTPSGDIRLIDFNIALALGEENVVGLSPGYASPEHYGLDFSSDRYVSNSPNSFRNIASSNENDMQSMMNKNSDITQTMGRNETMTLEQQENGRETVTMSMRKETRAKVSMRVVVPDARSDIYSLGATLYHFLSGTRPAKNAMDVIPLSNSEFSPQIVKIVSKSMMPNPDMRYQTANDMLYDFTHLRENDPRTIRQKRIFKIVCGIFSVMLIGNVLLTFTGLKRMQAEQKSLTLAEYSQSAIKDGNTELAIKYALEALPKDGIFTPGYKEEAQKALTDAVGVYDLSDGFKFTHTIELSAETFKVRLSPNGTRGAAISAYEVKIFDTKTGDTIEVLPIVKSALADAVFIDDERIAYAGENGLTVYDISKKSSLWSGKQATYIAVSSDKSTIAGIYRNENFATVYDINGNEIRTIDFGDNRQRVIENDVFADPMDNIFEINNDGTYLAVSFENGGVRLFDIYDSGNDITVYEESEYNHFEGGFCGKYFVFSGTNKDDSQFWSIDTESQDEVFSFAANGIVRVRVNDEAVYISNKSTIVKLDPETAEQKEAAFADSDVNNFSFSDGIAVVVTKKNEILFYDEDAKLTDRFDSGQAESSFAEISGEYTAVASKDTPIVKILNKKNYEDADFCQYDKEYEHDEARINKDKTRLMLFNYKGFRIYDMQGNVIADVSMPDAEKVYDQQYSKKSGNLAVIYDSVLRIYSGDDGSVIYEDDGLSSVSYTKYGVSTFDGNEVKLVDIDSAEVVQRGSATGTFGAYCGMIVTDKELNGGKFIGAGKTAEGYFFAVANGDICNVYNENGEKCFETPVYEDTEAFFTENEIIVAPLHGVPCVYSLKDGRKINELETDSYVTYVTELDNCIITDYITASRKSDILHYAIMVDKETYKPIAYMPMLCDISENELYFDCQNGVIRKTYVYDIDEIIEIGKKIEGE